MILNIAGNTKIKLVSGVKVIGATYGTYGTYGSSSSGGGLSSGLMAFYRLSNALDSSGNSNTLTNNGSVSFSTGKIGNAASFSDSAGGQYLTSPVNGYSANGMSVSLWFKKTGSKGTSGLISAVSADKTGWTVIREGGDWFFLAGNGSWSVQTSGLVSASASQNWTHLAITDDGSTMKFYVNGSSVATASTPTYASAAVKLGVFPHFSGNNGQTFDGLIDAAGIWHRALTLGEISSLYNSGAGYEI